MNQPQTQKIPLVNLKAEELKLFFLISRPTNINIADEKIEIVLGFNLEEAMSQIKLLPNFTAQYKGNLTINQLLAKIQLDNKVSIGEESKPIDQKKLNKEQFKNSLLLVVDDFCKSKKDKEAIRKIIEKIDKPNQKILSEYPKTSLKDLK